MDFTAREWGMERDEEMRREERGER